MNIIRFIKQLFCKHEPFNFRALNDGSGLVCKKCHKYYTAAAQETGK